MSDTTPRETSINEDFFVNEIKNDKKTDNEIFNEYFGYQNPSFLVKDLIKANQTKNNGIVNQTVDSNNELRNSVIKKRIPKNENPIALAQVKAGNNRVNLLNEIRQIVHSFYQSKKITKKVYNDIIKSV